MSALGIIMVIVHILLSVGVIFFALSRMQKNSAMGGGFGSGASQAQFGLDKKIDRQSKYEMVLAALFMVSCLLTTLLIK